jgi:hypothetical protein
LERTARFRGITPRISGLAVASVAWTSRPKGIESANLYHNKVYHDVKRAAEEFVRIFSFDPIEAKKTMLTPVKEER